MKFWQSLRQVRLSLECYLIVISAWLSLVFNHIFIHQLLEYSTLSGFKRILFNGGVSFILFAYMFLCLSIMVWRWNAKIIMVIVFLVTGATSYFCNVLGIVVDALQIQNALQTTSNEVGDLVSRDLILWMLFLVLLPMALLLGVRIKRTSKRKAWLSKIISILTVFALAIVMIFSFYLDLSSTLRNHREIRNLISPQNIIHAVWAYHRDHKRRENTQIMPYGQDAKHLPTTQQPAKLLVLVVGETARAESFSLNGYARQTNPELSKLNIINFSQVSSCGTETAVSVPCMFSGMPRLKYDENTAYSRQNLLDILQRAGYKVTWIDNDSGCKGVCNRIKNVTFPKLIEQKWCADGECQDQVLLDTLKDYLHHLAKDDQENRVIVLHQIGSHGPAYYKRTTAQFSPFQPTCDTNNIQDCNHDHLINIYDNTIVYTDHFLAQLIQILQITKLNQQSMMWYLSDHGESTGEHGLYLHGTPYMIAPSQQTHIPMLMWFSPLWQQHNPIQIPCLIKQRQKQLSQDNLFPTVLSLLDVNTKVKDPSLDMLTQCKSSS